MSARNFAWARTRPRCAAGQKRTTRHPHGHDVLSGRGGGINMHPGNVRLRKWVAQRRSEYNLAPSKAEKSRIVEEVYGLVTALDPPGRFLMREGTEKHAGRSGGPSLAHLAALEKAGALVGGEDRGVWVEIGRAKALAKVSQALREGAPRIRAAHATGLGAAEAGGGRGRRLGSGPGSGSGSGSVSGSVSGGGGWGDAEEARFRSGVLAGIQFQNREGMPAGISDPAPPNVVHSHTRALEPREQVGAKASSPESELRHVLYLQKRAAPPPPSVKEGPRDAGPKLGITLPSEDAARLTPTPNLLPMSPVFSLNESGSVGMITPYGLPPSILMDQPDFATMFNSPERNSAERASVLPPPPILLPPPFHKGQPTAPGPRE